MNEILQNDLQHLSNILDAAKRLGMDYLNRLQEVPVSKQSTCFALPPLPDQGLGALNTQQLFEQEFLPNILASSGGRYWGFVTGGTTPASIAGDWLTSVFDQNTQNASGGGDISASLELHTMNLLQSLFNLPEMFMGAMVTGATMSNFSGLAVARQWYGRQLNKDIAREGIGGRINIYAATPHSSAIKALSMLGVGSSNINIVPVIADRECIDMNALEKLLGQQPDEPFILISSGGTVNTVDFDDMKGIAALKTRYNFWWHVDAAFGGFAACSPEHAHLLAGWEMADSITIDFHKWLNVPYDSAVIFTRKEHALLQVQTFQNSNAPYLGDPLADFNYLNYVPENSRRFRALPVWFTLMAYGKEGYRSIVEDNIALANQLGEAIAASAYYELAAPVRLNTVCFTVKDTADRKEKITGVLRLLNERGKLFLTPTMYKGIPCIRAALVNWRTTANDVLIAVNELNDISEKLK